MRRFQYCLNWLFVISVVLFVFTVVSCEKENNDELRPHNSIGRLARLSVSLEDESISDSSRSALAEDGKIFLWTAKDQIKVFTNSQRAGALFESVNNEPSPKADFKGILDISSVSPEDPIYAVHPFTDDTSFDGTCLVTSLASEQEAFPNGFSDHLLPAIAVSYDTNLSFYQVATGIRFLVTTEGVKKVIFRGNQGETVSGKIKVAMNESGRPEVKEIDNGSQWVTLKAPDGGAFEMGKMYYLSVLPQRFEKGFTLTFLTDTKVARFEFLKDMSFKRAIWKQVNNLEEGINYGEKYLSNGVPVVEVKVADNAPIESKEVWLNCKIRIGDDYYDTVVSNGKIRGRGNATFGWDKKPYKIKFSNAIAPFGFPSNKVWVLLAMWNDKSLLRESIMADVSRRIGEPFTINTQYVDLYLNDDYRGTYLFVDQIEKGYSRINVGEAGFIIENDSYYLEEPVWFTSAHCGYHYTFKYPKIETEEEISFIKSYVDVFEKELLANSSEVFNLIDVDSFAKFFVVNELLANWEPNLYYYLPSRDDKLYMGPFWDFEWSLGLAENGNPENEWGWFFPPQKPSVQTKIWENKNYFSYLICYPEFISAVKRAWNGLKPQKEDILQNVSLLADAVKYSQLKNFKKWPILGTYTSVQLVAFDTWEEEVKYVHDYLTARFDWLDTYINAL